MPAGIGWVNPSGLDTTPVRMTPGGYPFSGGQHNCSSIDEMLVNELSLAGGTPRVSSSNPRMTGGPQAARGGDI
jgi:hypothetical protein